MLHELEEQEEKLIYFQLAPTKTIKCIHCGHKGQSEVEESTSVISFLLMVMILILTYDWGTWWFFVLFMVLFPCITGIFRIQTHSCPECLNEVNQTSIFSRLDLEDQIFTFKIGSFGMLIKRRTLLYSLLVIVVLGLTCYIIDSQSRHPLVNKVMQQTKKRIDYQMTWGKFQDFFENPNGFSNDEYSRLYNS